MSTTDPSDDERAVAFLAAERRRRTRNIGIFAVAAVLAAGAVAAIIFLGSSRSKRAAAQENVADGGPAEAPAEDPIEIKLAKAKLEQEPCQARAAVELGDALNEHDRYAETVAFADDFQKRCGNEARVLLWKKFYALQQLKQWQASVEVATELVDGKPDDVDYWWWRGESLLELKRFAEAAADFRQSIANSDLEDSSGVHVMHLAKIAKEIGRPCEGAFALGVYREAHGELNRSGANLHAELSVIGDCERLAGHGAAKLRAKAGQPVYRSPATVAGQSGTFLVDGRSPYVTVTRDFATRAGLATTPPKVTTWAAFELHQAELTVASTVELGRASAPEIDVAVVDTLPPGIDGVIGESFLWRFATFDDGEEMALKER
jgi:tetratricopeptide (TPR) repeat protein